MDKLEEIVERIRIDFDAKNEARDLTLRRSRELIRRCEIVEGRGEEVTCGSVIWNWQD